MSIDGESPTSSADQIADRISVRGILGIIVPVLLGLAVAQWVITIAFPVIPHDLVRTRAILEALTREPPHAVVFGNSIVMNGVDTRQLTNTAVQVSHSRKSGAFLNFASTVQTPAESYLYYQSLPKQTELVVQFVTPEVLEIDRPFNPNVFNAFYMYGYRPDFHTVASLSEIFGAPTARLLGRSKAWHAFQSRWVLKQFIDTAARGVLRHDLDLQRFYTDLYFPSPYTQRVSRSALQALLTQWAQTRRSKAFHPSGRQMKVLRLMATDAAASGCRVVFVLAPVHPWKQAVLGEEYLRAYRAAVESAVGSGVGYLDATEILNSAEFVDDVHPTREGARHLTSWLTMKLKAVE